ncbi:MAG: hypothetical protein HND48_07275 [Chloroflexi bacterium]|nr:hypothetical protein [Chloroflexota bacterium]
MSFNGRPISITDIGQHDVQRDRNADANRDACALVRLRHRNAHAPAEIGRGVFCCIDIA